MADLEPPPPPRVGPESHEPEAPVHAGTDVDPRVARSRAAIRDAATACFLDHGYADTSLDEVATRSGVAKRTIYNVIGDKETLFRDVLHDSLDRAEQFARQVADGVGQGDDPAAALRDLGLRYADVVMSGRVVALRRLLVREVGRFPDLARDYYERAPRRVLAAIADALADYQTRGLLRIRDAERAAEQFAFLVIGASLDEALFDPDGRPTSHDMVLGRARDGVDTFLRAHTPGESA